MKRKLVVLMVLILALCLVMGLVACSTKEPSKKPSEQEIEKPNIDIDGKPDVNPGEWFIVEKESQMPTYEEYGHVIMQNNKTGETRYIDLPKITSDEYDEQIITESTCMTHGKAKFTYKHGDMKNISFEMELPFGAHDFGADHLCKLCGEFDPSYGTEGLIYSFNGYVYNVVGYEGTEKNVYVPSIYNGKPVNGIENRAFQDNSIVESIRIADGVQMIEASAFRDCKNLKTLSLSKYYDGIWASSIFGCDNLSKIEVRNSSAALDDECQFMHYKLKNLSDTVVINELDGGVMFMNHAKNIVDGLLNIPEGVVRYEIEGLCMPEITAIKLPSTLRSVGDLQSLENLKTVKVDKVDTIVGLNVAQYYSRNEKWLSGKELLVGGEKLVNLTLPVIPSDSEEHPLIHTFSFGGLESLKSVTISDGVKSLSEGVFANCSNLEEVTIEGKMDNISDLAFDNCVSLKRINVKSLDDFLMISKGVNYNTSGIKLYVNGERVDVCRLSENIVDLPERCFGIVDYDMIVLHDKIQNIADSSFWMEKVGLMYVPQNIASEVGSMTMGNADAYFCEGDYTGSDSNNNIYTNVANNVLYKDNVLYMVKENVGQNGVKKCRASLAFSKVANPVVLEEVEIGGQLYKVKGLASTRHSDVVTKISLPFSIELNDFDVLSRYYSDVQLETAEGAEYTYVYGDIVYNNDGTHIVQGFGDGTIPEGVYTINGYRSDNVTHFKIPASVESVYAPNMSGCKNLQHITVDANNRKYASINDCLIDKKDNSVILGSANSVIPDGIDRIRDGAFENVKGLTRINIPDNVIVEYSAFGGLDNVVELTLGSNVTLRKMPIYCMPNLERLYLKDIKMLHELYLNNDDKLIFAKPVDIYVNGVLLEELTIDEGVSAIEKYDYSNIKSIKKLNLPSSLSVIEENAFSGLTSLTEFVAPKGIVNIGSGSFNDCTNLEKVDLANYNGFIYGFRNCYKAVFYVNDDEGLSSENKIYFTNGKENLGDMDANIKYVINGDSAYIKELRTDATEYRLPEEIEGCKVIRIDGVRGNNLTKITIPATYRSLGNHALSGLVNLEEIVFEPNSQIEHIGYKALSDLEKLNVITLDNWDNIKYIGESAFSGVKNIKFTIPKNVSYIGRDAFMGTMIEEAIIPASCKHFELTSLTECNNLKTLVMEEGAYMLPTSSINEMTSLVKLVLRGDGIMLSNCSTNLETLEVYDGVISLYNVNAPNLTTIVAGDGTKSFEISSTCNMPKLKSIRLASSVESVLFPGINEELSKNIAVDEVVVEPGSKLDVFEININCNNVVLPDNITSLWLGSGIKNKVINIPRSCTDRVYITDNPYIEEVYFDKECARDESGFFINCTGLKKIVLADSVEIIEDRAFMGCTNLTDVNMPRDLMYIRGAAFKGCSALASINMPNNLVSIDSVSFGGCTALKEVVLPATLNTISENSFDATTKVFCQGNRPEYVYGDKLIFNYDNIKGTTYTYAINGDGVGIIKYNGTDSIVNIPAKIEGKQVTSIIGAFNENAYVREIVLPEGMTMLHSNTFVNVPNLSKVTLPSTLKSLQYDVFIGTPKLRSLTIPKSVEYFNINATREINIDNYTVEDGNANYIGMDGNIVSRQRKYLVACKRNMTTVPEGVVGFNSECGAKYDDGLTINLPASFKDYECLNYKFEGNGLAFNVDANNRYFKIVDNMVITRNGILAKMLPGTKGIIPSDVKIIDCKLSSITGKVVIPSSVKLIRGLGVVDVTEVYIKSGVEIIGQRAVSGNDKTRLNVFVEDAVKPVGWADEWYNKDNTNVTYGVKM